MAKKTDSTITRMLIEMVALVAAVVILSTLIWNNVKPSNGPSAIYTPPETTEDAFFQNTDPIQTEPQSTQPLTAEEAISAYAAANGLTLEDYHMGFDYYPEKLIEAYEKCPEARDFILRAPFEYNKTHEKDMSEFENVDGVPHFIQWDDRWGYTKYAYGLGGITGCGPTCLSMVVYYYTQDPTYTPDYMMKFAEENTYIGTEYDENGKLTGGTEWILFSKGGPKLGFNVKEVPLDKGVLTRYLKAGTPVICHVGPCVFTTTGHYIVMTGYDAENDRILVKDPNSVELTNRGCTYEEIEKAIKNMWVLTPKQE